MTQIPINLHKRLTFLADLLTTNSRSLTKIGSLCLLTKLNSIRKIRLHIKSDEFRINIKWIQLTVRMVISQGPFLSVPIES